MEFYLVVVKREGFTHTSQVVTCRINRLKSSLADFLLNNFFFPGLVPFLLSRVVDKISMT